MPILTGAKRSQLRKALRFVIEPGRGSEATLKVWVPSPKSDEPVERSIIVDQFLRGIEKAPSSVQIPRLAGLPAWEGFVKALKVGDLLMLEWTVEAGLARSAQPGGEQWRARLIGQREGKQAAEFIIRATSAPGGPARPTAPAAHSQVGAARAPGAPARPSERDRGRERPR